MNGLDARAGRADDAAESPALSFLEVTAMQRLSLLVTASIVACLLFAMPDRGARAQPGVDLVSMAISPAELGPTWSVVDATLNEEGGFLTVSYQREGSSVSAPALLDLLLFWDPNGSIPTSRVFDTAMEVLATRYLPFVLTADRVGAARVGQDTIQARTALTLGLNQFLGDLLVWRRGPIIALMLYTVPEDVNVVPIAEQQDAKIAAALAALTPSPSPSPQP
jgi:hypothetical protein